MKLQKNDRLLFIGDSITDCGRSTSCRGRKFRAGTWICGPSVCAVAVRLSRTDAASAGIAGIRSGI